MSMTHHERMHDHAVCARVDAERNGAPGLRFMEYNGTLQATATQLQPAPHRLVACVPYTSVYIDTRHPGNKPHKPTDSLNNLNTT